MLFIGSAVRCCQLVQRLRSGVAEGRGEEVDRQRRRIVWGFSTLAVEGPQNQGAKVFALAKDPCFMRLPTGGKCAAALPSRVSWGVGQVG